MSTATHFIPSVNGNGKDEQNVVRKCDFEYKGDRFVIPEGMDLTEAVAALEKQRKEEQVVVSINEPIKAFPLDGAAAFMRVLQRRYGWQNLVPTDMGFWGGMRPPTMLSVEIGPNERVQVPWGDCTIPKIDGTLTTSWYDEQGMACFKLTGQVKRMHERVVAEIAKEIREEVRLRSIYRGKAIKISFRDGDGERKDFDPSYTPKFIDPTQITDEPIFSAKIEKALQINLFNPILYSEMCRIKGISLKKGVLLAGPFGTGKTLTAFTLARMCVENGWTFLYLEDVRDLDLAIGFAKLYGPCCLFAEDVDRATNGPRDAQMDKILNTIDGIESKDKAQGLITVLTTNNLNNINPAFIRPGRIDAIVEIMPPDEMACVRIVKKYISDGGCVIHDSDQDIGVAIRKLLGANAAFFKVVVEQSKLSAIALARADEPLAVTAADLEAATESMIVHAKLINPHHGDKPLSEMANTEVCDPLQFAMDIMVQKMAEAFFDQIATPKKLAGILRKSMRRRPGDPSDN